MTSPTSTALTVTRNWGLSWVPAPNRPGEFVPVLPDDMPQEDKDGALAYARLHYAKIRYALLREQHKSRMVAKTEGYHV